MAKKLPKQYNIDTHNSEDSQCVRYNLLNTLNQFYALKLEIKDFEVPIIPNEIGITSNNILEEGLIQAIKTLNVTGLEHRITAYLSREIVDPIKFFAANAKDKLNVSRNEFNSYKQLRQRELSSLGVNIKDENISLDTIKNFVLNGDRVVIGVNMGEYFKSDFKDYFPEIYAEMEEVVLSGGLNYNHIISLVDYDFKTDRFTFEETINEAPARILYMDAQTLYAAASNVIGNRGNIETVIFSK